MDWVILIAIFLGFIGIAAGLHCENQDQKTIKDLQRRLDKLEKEAQ